MDLDTALSVLSTDPDHPVDLVELALQVASDEYAHLDIASYLDKIDELADRLRPRLSGSISADAVELTHLLFVEEGYKGNANRYYDPRNSYFNDVLDRKLGIPITLSLLAIAVGNRAGLEVVGVSLPGHFIAKLVSADGGELLFDPFNGGSFLDAEGCERLVATVTGQPFTLTPESLLATTNASIITRILNNLKAVYLKNADFPRAAQVMSRLIQLTPDDPVQRRDLGVSLFHADLPGRAIAHLKFYLEAFPEAEDKQTVRDFLNDAKAEVARWN